MAHGEIGRKAYNAAILRLKTLHKEDWERIIAEERTIRGLPSNSMDDIKRKKMEYFQSQIEKYEEKLKEINDARN